MKTKALFLSLFATLALASNPFSNQQASSSSSSRNRAEPVDEIPFSELEDGLPINLTHTQPLQSIIATTFPSIPERIAESNAVQNMINGWILENADPDFMRKSLKYMKTMSNAKIRSEAKRLIEYSNMARAIFDTGLTLIQTYEAARAEDIRQQLQNVPAQPSQSSSTPPQSLSPLLTRITPQQASHATKDPASDHQDFQSTNNPVGDPAILNSNLEKEKRLIEALVDALLSETLAISASPSPQQPNSGILSSMTADEAVKAQPSLAPSSSSSKKSQKHVHFNLQEDKQTSSVQQQQEPSMTLGSISSRANPDEIEFLKQWAASELRKIGINSARPLTESSVLENSTDNSSSSSSEAEAAPKRKRKPASSSLTKSDEKAPKKQRPIPKHFLLNNF